MSQDPIVSKGTRFIYGDKSLVVKRILKTGVLFEDGYVASFAEVEGWLENSLDNSVAKP